MYVTQTRLGVIPVAAAIPAVTAALPAVAKLFKRKKKKRRREAPPPPAAIAPPPAAIAPLAPTFGVPGWVWPVGIGAAALLVGAVILRR